MPRRAQESRAYGVLASSWPGLTGLADLPAAPSGGRNASKDNERSSRQSCTGGKMSKSQSAPGIVGPFAGMDVPWLLKMRAQSRRDHPFLVWAPFDAPARIWAYGGFWEGVGAPAAGA